MKVTRVVVRSFKRFADLVVDEIPPSARMVVLAGPNGQGKSSLFDAFLVWQRARTVGYSRIAEYYDRGMDVGPEPVDRRIQIDFDGAAPAPGTDEVRKAFCFRSAYRNEPDLQLHQLERVGAVFAEQRFSRMIESDVSVALNYRRLVSDAFDDVFERVAPGVTVGRWRDSLIGDLRDSLARLFPDLTLNSLGSPLQRATFRFTKGIIRGFEYQNLSGGEKAAFDLLLDIIVRRRDYNDTVFCIDEPEAHLNPGLHGSFLDELLGLINEPSQLWIATHSIGMLRRARDLEAQNPGQVAFINFDGQNFDEAVVLGPVKPNRAFWDSALQVALVDLAQLIAPRILVLCEGNPKSHTSSKNSDFDARCYNIIFGDQKPDVKFVSGGASSDVVGDRFGIARAIPTIVSGTEVFKLIDHDDHAPADIAEYRKRGIMVLSRRHIESYLWDDEILTELCVQRGHADRAEALLAEKAAAITRSRARGNPPDDVKSAVGELFNVVRTCLGLAGMGNDASSFARNTLAPLIKPGMRTYAELESDIFAFHGRMTRQEC